MAEMTDYETKEFVWSDKDRNGKLTYEEMVRGQAIPQPVIHEDPHDEYMDEVDADKDKHVTLSEHLDPIAEPNEEDKKSMSEEDIKLHKESIAEELVRARAVVGRAWWPTLAVRLPGNNAMPPPRTCTRITRRGVLPVQEEERKRFTKADKNQDGKLSSAEYAAMGADVPCCDAEKEQRGQGTPNTTPPKRCGARVCCVRYLTCLYCMPCTLVHYSSYKARGFAHPPADGGRGPR